MAEEKVSELLHGPFKTDDFASYIYGQNDKIGGDNPVLEIRGWGYLTGLGHGALGLDHAAAVAEQKRFAQFVVDALNASPSQPKTGEVSVKGLEWSDDIESVAVGITGRYSIRKIDGDWRCLHNGLTVGWYDTIGAAKHGAQADYEARIRSALVSIKREG